MSSDCGAPAVNAFNREFVPSPRTEATLAIVVHALYNQALLRPVQEAVVILIGLPVLLAFIFWRSEKILRKYLQSLKRTFSPEIVGDMLCYLQLSIELSARAKGDLLRREMGFAVTPDPEVPSQIREMNWLESRIGRTRKLALAPLLGRSRRDIWEMRQMAGSE
jgi:hypothetical protein